MKKIVSTVVLSFLLVSAFSQATYYWRGGASGSWTTNSNWNLALDGSSTSRNTPNVGDTLIFDGSSSNFIGSSALSPLTVTAVPYQTIKNLVFRNSAFVRFTNSPGTASTGTTAAGTFIGTQPNASGQTITGTGSSFTTFFAVGDFISYGTTNTGTGGANSIGQITAINSNTSLTQSNGNLAMLATNGTSTFCIKDAMVRITSGMSVDATSYFEMASSAPLIFKLSEGAKGDVYGTINMSTNFQKIAVVDSNSTASLTFYSGSKFQFTGTQSSAPFDGLANANNNNVIFKYGSQYENNSTTAATANSCGSLYGAVIPFSVVSFEKGSTYVQNSNQISSMLGGAYRSLPNVILNGATSGMQSTLMVDTLTVSSNTNWTNTSGSYFPIKGDLIVNGTYTGAASTPVFVFFGNTTQNVRVTGTIASGGFNKFIVAPTSTLKLGSNVIQSTNTTTTSFTRVFGTINFDTYALQAASTTSNTLQGYNANSVTTATQDSGTVLASSPNLISFPSSIAGLTQGMQITGVGVPDNTIILITSGLTVTTSNPIAPTTSLVVTSNVSAGGSTFITANSGGVGGSYPNSAAIFTFPTSSGVGTNFIFNAPTTTPFPIATNVYANNLTLGGNVTSNTTNVYVNGILNLGGNTFTIPEADTLRITSGNAIQGASATKFIALGVNATTGDRGALKIGNISSSTVFPIGANGNYLPVTITPAGTAEDYTISAFTGATTNAQPNGTAIDNVKKATIVDAVWTIKANTIPSSAVGLQFGWPTALEGSSFTGYANNQIGIANYTSDWGVFATANSNNTANTAASNFTTFGSFSVGLVNSTLPVKFASISAKVVNSTAKVSWQVATEVSVAKYIIESSKDGLNFTEKGFVAATGNYNYSFVDVTPFGGDNYYRVYSVDISGAITYSSLVKISLANVSVASKVSIYPNPIVDRTINIGLNNLPVAAYTLQVIDGFGKTIATKFIQHNGGTGNYTVELPQGLATGNYYITVKDLTRIIVSKSVLVK